MVNIGIECGGTFTDMAVTDENGQLVRVAKVLSTPDDPVVAIRMLLDELPPELQRNATLHHGSTIATNALIERSGPRVALVSTSGFGDVIFIQRQDRTRMFDLKYQRPEHLVTEDSSFEVRERVDSQGSTLVDIDLEQAHEVANSIAERRILDVAVCLMHSYANSAHERRIGDIIRERVPDARVVLSSDVSAEFREYERASTTVIAAFLARRITDYLGNLQRLAAEAGISNVEIMQSNGGRVPVPSAIANPLGMLRSGPAAGVAGAIAIAANAGIHDFITLDMGGTSTDVALVQQLSVEETTEMYESGLPISVPMVDIVAVGAGGGSIVRLDSGGMLKIGPESAGAQPGPASYGQGGTLPTVTDANLVRGILRGENRLSDDLRLDVEAAAESLSGLADSLQMDHQDLAEQATRLASAQMAGAIRIATVEKGYDVDGHTLIAYGGAGPMHAAEVADELRIRTVLVPPHNGLISAYGLLVSNFKRHFSQTAVTTMSVENWNAIRDVMQSLREEALAALHAEQIHDEQLCFRYSIDMRYRGQGYELEVPAPLETDSAEAWCEAFHELHFERYGYANREAEVQAVTLRLRAENVGSTPAPLHIPFTDSPEVQAVIREDGSRIMCTFVQRSALRPGFSADGPMVVEDATSTTYIPTGWQVLVDESFNLVLRK